MKVSSFIGNTLKKYPAHIGAQSSGAVILRALPKSRSIRYGRWSSWRENMTKNVFKTRNLPQSHEVHWRGRKRKFSTRFISSHARKSRRNHMEKSVHTTEKNPSPSSSRYGDVISHFQTSVKHQDNFTNLFILDWN